MATQLMTREQEQLRESLERSQRGLSRPPTLYRLGQIKSASKHSGLMTFVASTEDEDRGRDVIRQDGWDLDNFRRNPVYMFGHDYSRPPIGTVPKVWVENRKLFNTVRFDEDDRFAAEIARKYRSGVLRAQSVGFRPIEFKERRGGGIEFTRAELLEISAVSIPMNAQALRKGLTSVSPIRGDDPFDRFESRLRRYSYRKQGKITPGQALRIRMALKSIIRS
jgi:HK97 family phage prohead protease